MNKKLKNNKNTLDDKEISEDFLRYSINLIILAGSSFVGEIKHGLTQEMAAKV